MVNHTNNYTVTFTYPSDVIMQGGGVISNRSRIDSETSASSESSRGSGKPPRRRSHRPRGCRGGSNRRRNNSSDDKGNKRNHPSKCKSNNYNNNAVVVVNNENIRKLDNLKIHGKEPKQSHQGNPLHNISILNRNFGIDNSQAYPVAITPSKAGTEYSFAGENYNDVASFHNEHRLDDYQNIHPSFSDSSSDGMIAMDGRIFPRPPAYEVARNNDGILPPLPPNAFFNEPIVCLHVEHVLSIFFQVTQNVCYHGICPQK